MAASDKDEKMKEAAANRQVRTHFAFAISPCAWDMPHTAPQLHLWSPCDRLR